MIEAMFFLIMIYVSGAIFFTIVTENIYSGILFPLILFMGLKRRAKQIIRDEK